MVLTIDEKIIVTARFTKPGAPAANGPESSQLPKSA
jgi:hypothetical protein